VETKCSNCAGPVFIPLDRGVANCKNCGKLVGRHCIQCNVAMPKGTEYCPSCGLSYADTQKQAIKIAWQKNGPNFLITMLITLVICIGCWLFFSGILNRPVEQASIQFISSEVSLVPKSAINPEIVAEGREMAELRITWKNTGSTNIHGVKADIELLDNQGQVIEKMKYWVYVADGWTIPGEKPSPNASPGIASGDTYTDPPGEGFLLTTTGLAIVPTNARVTALYVVQ
jgi:predicted nucleic acid-binding Zn ribbon protein